MKNPINDADIDDTFLTEPDETSPLSLAGGIRLSFNISSTDIGFEKLYQGLTETDSAIDRSKQIKRILFDSYEGKPSSVSKCSTDIFPTHHHSFKIVFRVSSRDIGLEWLYHELAPMTSAFARNQHVRRLLYAACTERIVKGNLASLKAGMTSEFSAETEIAANPAPTRWPTTPALKPTAVLTDEQIEARNAKRAKQHKQNVTIFERQT